VIDHEVLRWLCYC